MIRRARHGSPWFKPTTIRRQSRLLAVAPAPASSPPPPPSVDLIMGLVRVYGAQCLAYGKSPTDYSLSVIDEQEELIRHNVALLEGWLSGTQFLLSDLRKTLDPPEEPS